MAPNALRKALVEPVRKHVLDVERWKDAILAETFKSKVCVSDEKESETYFMSLVCAQIDEVAQKDLIVYGDDPTETNAAAIKERIKDMRDEQGIPLRPLHKPEKPYVIRFSAKSVFRELGLPTEKLDHVMFAYACAMAYGVVQTFDIKPDAVKEIQAKANSELKRLPIVLSHFAYVVVDDVEDTLNCFGGIDGVKKALFPKGTPPIYFKTNLDAELVPVSVVTRNDYIRFVKEGCRVVTSYMSEATFEELKQSQGIEFLKKMPNHNFTLFRS